MARPTFETFVAEERQRWQKEKEDLLSKRQEIEDQIAAAETELHAISLYEQAKQGKFPVAETKTRRPRESAGPRAPRGSRDELRNQILELVGQFPQGLTAEGINNELHANDAKQKQKIANLLSLMKKDNLLSQEQRREPYKIPPPIKEPYEAA